jgi:signal transduction histidine kinase
MSTLGLPFNLSTHPAPPLRLWISHWARPISESLLPRLARLNPEVTLLDAGAEPEGPAIPLLDAADLSGTDGEALFRAVQRALPGRPIIVGGSRDRGTLLDAINRWRAFRLVPQGSPVQAIVVAICQAHEALRLETAIGSSVDELEVECNVLEVALEELRATQEKLLHAERLATVGRFVGTLLARLERALGGLGVLERARERFPDSTELGWSLEYAVDGIRSFGALLRDIVALADDTHDSALSPEEEQLDPFMERAIAFLRHDPLVRERGVEGILESGATVRIDRPRMLHVLMNLLRNAAQATGKRGRITLRTRKEGPRAVIEVEDDGCGMTEEVRAMLFTPFFTTKGHGGMGLGLRLSRTAVELHGGTLSCESAPGEGSCFRIELPLA